MERANGRSEWNERLDGANGKSDGLAVALTPFFFVDTSLTLESRVGGDDDAEQEGRGATPEVPPVQRGVQGRGPSVIAAAAGAGHDGRRRGARVGNRAGIVDRMG